MLAMLLLFAQATTPPAQALDPKAAELVLKFIKEQTDEAHGQLTAERCAEIRKVGFAKGMMEADKKYGLRSVDWKALLHDCSIYMLAYQEGLIEGSVAEAVEAAKNKKK